MLFLFSLRVISVIWGLISDKVADAAGQQLDTTLNRIRDDISRRWQAVGMLKSILPSIHYPWEIKSHSIELLLSIMDGYDPKESDDSSVDLSSFTPSIFAVLKVQLLFYFSLEESFPNSVCSYRGITFQGIERIIICAPDASSRKKYFGALKKACY